MKGGDGFGVVDVDGRWAHFLVVVAKLLVARRAGDWEGSPLVFRCSRSLVNICRKNWKKMTL